MKLGFLGLGMMGMPIVENILAKGESELYFFCTQSGSYPKNKCLGWKTGKVAERVRKNM